MIEIHQQTLDNVAEIEYLHYREQIAGMLMQGFPEQFENIDYARSYVDSARRDLREFGVVEEAELSYWCLFSATFQDPKFYARNDIHPYLKSGGKGKLGILYQMVASGLLQVIEKSREARQCRGH
jgi:hypothetical protein